MTAPPSDLQPMTYPRWVQWFRAKLVDAQAERDSRPFPGWHEFELDRALRALNEAQEKMGRPRGTLPQVRRAEEQAAGHVDYTVKWALGLTDILYGGPR